MFISSHSLSENIHFPLHVSGLIKNFVELIEDLNTCPPITFRSQPASAARAVEAGAPEAEDVAPTAAGRLRGGGGGGGGPPPALGGRRLAAAQRAGGRRRRRRALHEAPEGRRMEGLEQPRPKQCNATIPIDLL